MVCTTVLPPRLSGVRDLSEYSLTLLQENTGNGSRESGLWENSLLLGLSAVDKGDMATTQIQKQYVIYSRCPYLRFFEGLL